MSVRHLTTPTKIAEAIERQGVMGEAIDPPSKAALAGSRSRLVKELRKQGVEDPSGLIDRVKKNIADHGDADGLYEDTDEVRAHELLRRELNSGWER